MISFSRDSGELERRYAEYLKLGHNVFESMLEFQQLYAVEQVARGKRRYLKDLSEIESFNIPHHKKEGMRPQKLEIAQMAYLVEVGFSKTRLISEFDL